MDDTLGKRIAAYRKALGLTQEALAEQLGITAQAVSKWENGQSCPDIFMLPKLADIFSCTTDALLGMASTELQRPATDAPPAKEAEKQATGFRWKALASPAAAFGFWLFLTGLVALIDALRLPPYDLVRISLLHIVLSSAVFAFGLFSLLRRFSLLGVGCAMAGGGFLFNIITEPNIADMDWYVPLLAAVALLGLDLLVDTLMGRRCSLPEGHRSPACTRNSFSCEEDSFSCFTSFGADKHPITVPKLSHGQAEVNFGEMTLDLTGCQQFAEGCRLELRSSFGELNLILPRSCQAVTTVKTAFADCDTLGTPDPDPDSRIYVNGNVSFGHITIRYI